MLCCMKCVKKRAGNAAKEMKETDSESSSEDEVQIGELDVPESNEEILACRPFTTADFQEMIDGYSYTEMYDQDEVGNYNVKKKDVGKEVWIDMSKPRLCSYNSKHAYNWDTGKVDKETNILGGTSPSSTTKPKVEQMGITLRQLRAVMANVIRRCTMEKWKDFEGNVLTPETVTFYDVNRYVIRPFSKKTEQSFVTSLPSTAGPQCPRFVVNHFWGGPVCNFIKCVEQCVRDFARNDSGYGDQDSRGGGMTIDTPIWVCAFANNQWTLDEDILDDPKESGFAKAMEVAQGRTITILDKKGVIFSRACCIHELHLTLLGQQLEDRKEGSKRGLWAVYTAEEHTYKSPADHEEEREAVGVISGGVTSDGDDTRQIIARERSFPFELMKKALYIKVEEAESSNETDRIRILNSIMGRSGNELNDAPADTHESYNDLNNVIRAAFASSEAILRVATKKDDNEWMDILCALSNGTNKEQMEFDFGPNDNWSGLNLTRATQLISHIPLTIEGLVIREAKFGLEFFEALARRIKDFTNLKSLTIWDSLIEVEEGGRDAGVTLAEALASNSTINRLNLYSTNLMEPANAAQWADALRKNVTLTTLCLDNVDSGIEEELRVSMKERVPKLDITIN